MANSLNKPVQFLHTIDDNVDIPFITSIVVVLDGVGLPEQQCPERGHSLIDFGLRKPGSKQYYVHSFFFS